MTNTSLPERISPAEAHAKMKDEGYTYVDVRTPEEFAGGRPAGSVNIPLDDAFVAAMEARFPKDARIVLGCRAGNRSLRAWHALSAAGFHEPCSSSARASMPRRGRSAK